MAMIKRNRLTIGFLALVLALEVVACHIADQTIGWGVAFLLAAVSLFVDLIVLAIGLYHFRFGFVVGMSYLALVSVYILPLGLRWHFIDSEAKRIVSWAYSEKEKTGRFPNDLSGYSFLRPEYKGYIFYTAGHYTDEGIKSEAQSFELSYVIEPSTGTNHLYNSRYTQYGWQYQDD